MMWSKVGDYSVKIVLAATIYLWKQTYLNFIDFYMVMSRQSGVIEPGSLVTVSIGVPVLPGLISDDVWPQKEARAKVTPASGEIE